MRLTFTVDARLLLELGERLVGRPHIALAELIKNAYDADARHVELTFAPDQIRVADDGHGMSERTFTERWMRIGTTQKVRQRVSPALGRPLTGSKGVGRLAVQLLAASFELRSVALADPADLLADRPPRLEEGIQAAIHWPDAQDYDELTKVGVDFELVAEAGPFAAGSRHGTEIVLTDLTNEWGASAFADLAREIWALQPPFRHQLDAMHAFQVVLRTPFDDVQESFDAQMSALMTIHTALVTGRLLGRDEQGPRAATRFAFPEREVDVDEDGVLQTATGADPEPRVLAATRNLLIEVDIRGAAIERFVVEIAGCQVDALQFEIRVFDLRYRQSAGIKVGAAREYLNSFGGVHIYDSEFRLPYYGPDADWLKLELDHARRLSNSRLVPGQLKVRNGMLDLPSNKRVFGAVTISTAAEQEATRGSGRRISDALSIQITRDRLVDNLAFDQMTRAVRLSLDLYALTRAKTKARGELRRRGGVRPDSDAAIRRASEAIEALRDDLPAAEYRTLRDSIDTVAEDLDQRSRETKAYASLLGALATAGMTSLAYEHEVARQRRYVIGLARRLKKIAASAPPQLAARLNTEADKLQKWQERSRRIRSLFSPLLDEENRVVSDRYNALKLVDDVVESLAVLARGTTVDRSQVSAQLTLPMGTYAAWTAMLQNLLTNAFRATLDSRPACVLIDSGSQGGRAWLRIQDNGVGLDTQDGERMFLPFERGIENTPKATELGLGGSGLGLTIVRMIADELGATVAFAAPEPGWNTAVRIEWRD